MSGGEWQKEVMNHMRLRFEDLQAAARASGVPSVDNIDCAILERHGRISVFGKQH